MKLLRVALILGLLLMSTTWVVSAMPPDSPQHLGRAQFLDFPDCWIFDLDFEWYYIEDCSPTISLITNSKTNVMHWHAQAQLPEGAALPEQGAYKVTYEDTGFACYWEEGVETTNYSITITPDGKFIASCHFRPDKWQPY